MQKIRTTPLQRRKRTKEEGLRGSGSVASGMYMIYDIPCIPTLAQGNWKAPALQKLQNELKDFSEGQISVIKKCLMK